jgi:hypothetical protein
MWITSKLTREQLSRKIADQDESGINPALRHVAKQILIPGDPLVSPTSWWNNWYMILKGWKTVVVFGTGSFVDRFHVGFIASDGTVHRGPLIEGKTHFAALIGREDATFFATDARGYFIPLTVQERMSRVKYLSSHYKTSAQLV